ncbi:hypothetical protein [Actinomadura madurae]|uniref:hypothetical protein n=1 Tax=Actinomadura madurae TaxID=1993 RepID=UPI0020D24D45|nr:hypothetical protein [Actinomadura madurae]MCP9949617.1 hypothetical protein [Actinomadura madurae]MCP9966370.1 hypothetical protein [Actinomadura madurae]MCP9978857.1 hypothetical protein [Actinomadura madurae]MCQ0009611.1 hypothetical protein [Actinomadura madurae]MCQ0015048.1 hypothetical protein [Actinomadura madurae]
MTPRWITVLAGASVLIAGAAAGPVGAREAGRSETPVASTSPVTEVSESVVRVRVPLPASAGPRPEACDWLSYLRFRHKDGPAESARADRILVAQPGILEGAGAFDSVARNTVAAAARSGRHIEFWALDRRSNCLEDGTGIQAGLKAKDVHLAVDYYYRQKEVDGRKFAGYQTNDQVKWLQHVGLDQTVRDQYDLMIKELPDQAARKRKMMCGGHSLGGVLTAYFAEWDFDGNPSTTGDAGYNQCSGYFALDTRIETGLPGFGDGFPEDWVPLLRFGAGAVQAGLETGVVPRALSAPAVVNTETMNLLGIAGLAARLAPGGVSDLSTYIPSSFNTDTTYRVLFSKDYPTFLKGSPTVRDFRFTNAAALGGLLDDNSEPLAFMQASVGFWDGGKIVDKEFPAPNDLEESGLGGLSRLLGKEKKAIPDEPGGPLFTWRNFDRVGAPDDPVHKSKDGRPFTTAGKEVTDIAELARSLSEHPLDFTEHYFPTKMVTDIALADAPGIADDAVHEGGLTANPTLNLEAGDGLFSDPRPGDVVAPGYQHLDVLTASAVQNGGRPEPISVNLAAFAAR